MMYIHICSFNTTYTYSRMYIHSFKSIQQTKKGLLNRNNVEFYSGYMNDKTEINKDTKSIKVGKQIIKLRYKIIQNLVGVSPHKEYSQYGMI